jgi:hypothetical protein
MFIFPMYEGHCDMAIVQLAEIPHPSYSAACRNQVCPHPNYGAAYGNPPKYGVYRGKHNFFSQGKFFSLLSLGIQATNLSEGNI